MEDKIMQCIKNLNATAIDLNMSNDYTGAEKFDILYHRIRNNCILINELLNSMKTNNQKIEAIIKAIILLGYPEVNITMINKSINNNIKNSNDDNLNDDNLKELMQLNGLITIIKLLGFNATKDFNEIIDKIRQPNDDLDSIEYYKNTVNTTMPNKKFINALITLYKNVK